MCLFDPELTPAATTEEAMEPQLLPTLHIVSSFQTFFTSSSSLPQQHNQDENEKNHRSNNSNENEKIRMMMIPLNFTKYSVIPTIYKKLICVHKVSLIVGLYTTIAIAVGPVVILIIISNIIETVKMTMAVINNNNNSSAAFDDDENNDVHDVSAFDDDD